MSDNTPHGHVDGLPLRPHDVPEPSSVDAPVPPAGLPTALPTALPATLPTALPTTLPTSLPTGLPTAPTAAHLPLRPGAPTAPAVVSVPAPVVPAVVGGGVRVDRASVEGHATDGARDHVRPVADAPVAPASASTPGVDTLTDPADQESRLLLDDLLVAMVEEGGSDLHLAAGSPPVTRVRGEMRPIQDAAVLTPKAVQDLMYGIMNNKQRQRFEERWELDFAYTVPGQARFRVNVLKQRGSVGAVMRTIPWEIKSLEALGLPPEIGEFANLPRGLVLVTGPTGSGKSTTLAAIIDKANRTRRGHIMTIEDPIEFIHKHRGCIVNQREVGEDTHSFQDALKHVLRQDPDIILIGEMRDLETISTALTAAETGHLVFGTLHTQSAQETVTRIIDVFPPEQQQQVQTQLAASLQGVVCQTLCRTADGSGRQAAVEIMIGTPGVRAMIREKKLQQIQGALQSGGKFGMQTLNQDLAAHVKSGRITYQQGLEKCSDREDFNALVGGPEAGARYGRVAQAAHPGAGLPTGVAPAVPPAVHRGS